MKLFDKLKKQKNIQYIVVRTGDDGYNRDYVIVESFSDWDSMFDYMDQALKHDHNNPKDFQIFEVRKELKAKRVKSRVQSVEITI